MRNESKDEVMSEAKKLLAIISDYRVKPKLEHIEHWLSQFDPAARLPIVTELTNILSKSYLSAKTTEDFLRGLISNPKLAGNNAASFWKGANFFNAQQGGHSQAELLDLFGTLLKSETGLKLKECGSQKGPIIYLDDLLLSGNRIVNDFRAWIPEHAPKSSAVHAIFMGIHTGGSFYAQKAIPEMAGKAEKNLTLTLWSVLRLENFSNSGASADVFRLRALPEDERTARYIQEHIQGDPAVMRPEKEHNKSTLFTSEKARHFLEQTFWSKGLNIREIAHNLKETHRPLGYTSTNSANKLGFGATVVTYRNCPNNCPLAYWVGDPWYPLFERKIN